MIQQGLGLSVYRYNLSQAGEATIAQQCGYFHLWRFENDDGTISLDGEIEAQFGTRATIADWVPFTYDGNAQLIPAVDLVRLRWNAQPGRWVRVLVSRDPAAIDLRNPPSRQIVFQGQATAMRPSSVAVGTTAAQIVQADTRRSRVIIHAPIGNTDRVFVGALGVTSATGMPLEPGASFTGLSSARYDGISPTAGQTLRILEELS